MVSVVQVMAGAAVGGAEAFFERLALALPRDRIAQTLIVRRNEAREARLRAGGHAPLALRFGGPFDFATRREIRRVIRERQPQVVLAWMNRATAASPRTVRGERFALIGRLGGYYSLKYYRHCHHLIGNTKGICDYLVGKGWPGNRVHHLPNFADVYHGPPIDRSEIRVPEGRHMVLAAGRLHVNKGFDILIRALPQVPDVQLCIAGSGPDEGMLKKLADAEGIADRVTWLGWVQDLGPLYRAAELFVCSSRHEPLGNVIIEAWAHGCPVVAAAAQGPSELIQDGQDGLLVPVDNPQGLATAINHVLREPAQARSMGLAGSSRYESTFSRDVVVERYTEFLETVTP